MKPVIAGLFTLLVATSDVLGVSVRRTPVAVRQQSSLQTDLDRILDDPILARALVGVRIDALDAATGEATTVYRRNAEKFVMPASNMKLLTLATAADRLGWDYRYETTLDAIGSIEGGSLKGDLVVTGSGDPSIGAQDADGSGVFAEWARAVAAAGITRVDGGLIGDDNAFDDDNLGRGWAWDYLADGYAAPVGALSYNENVAVVRLTAGKSAGDPVTIALSPPGHSLKVTNEVRTAASDTTTNVDLLRLPGNAALTIRGTVPAGGRAAVRTAAIDNPTKFFVEAFKHELESRGIHVRDGAWDVDDVRLPATGTRRRIATRQSPPLSAMAGYFLKVSQNFYGETILKTLGHTNGAVGTSIGGRNVVRDTLATWGVPPDSFVMYDGSGLSRYNYVTADAIVTILEHMWRDEPLRGPFVAALPISGRDGTLESRMKDTILEGRVEAKTGTIANARALSGYLITATGGRLVFSIIANNFTAPSSQVDAVAEKLLARLAAVTHSPNHPLTH